MNRLWSPSIRELTAYVPGEQPAIPGLVKLNANENPYPPSPHAIHAIRAAADDSLRLYPNADSTPLKNAIASYHSVEPGQVFIGNGSDEVLAHAFNAFFKQELPIQFPEITYSFYPVYCRLYGIEFAMVPLRDGMRIAVEDYHRPSGGIVFANPNAPTGIALSLSDIETLLKANPDCVVLVDEAYVDFGGESAIPLIKTYPNLLVVQTLSKSRSLAGLRVGFAVGDASLIEGLGRVKGSFNAFPLDTPAMAGAIASFDDEAWFQDKRARVMATRERLSLQLRTLGFEVLPSSTNFVFVTHPQHQAASLLAELRERKVLVRHFRQQGLENHLRISIGTDAENDALHAALVDIIGERR